MPEFVPVTVHIPEDQLSAFHEIMAVFHRPTSSEYQETMAVVHRSPRSLPANPARQPWVKGDERLAKQVYGACSPRAKLVLAYLADHPGQKVNGAEIAQGLGISNGRMAIAGVMVSVSRRCGEVGREVPYKLQYETGIAGAFYIVSNDVAALFKAAAK